VFTSPLLSSFSVKFIIRSNFLLFSNFSFQYFKWKIQKITILHCVPKNRACILWPITFTNIHQYQCHLIELFLQHYLIIYHKNYSHSSVPAATVATATSDQRLCYYSASAHRARATVEYLRQATPDFISPDLWQWPSNSPT